MPPSTSARLAFTSHKSWEDYRIGSALRVTWCHCLTRPKVLSTTSLVIVHPASAYIPPVTGSSPPPGHPPEISRVDGKKTGSHSEDVPNQCQHHLHLFPSCWLARMAPSPPHPVLPSLLLGTGLSSHPHANCHIPLPRLLSMAILALLWKSEDPIPPPSSVSNLLCVLEQVPCLSGPQKPVCATRSGF